MNGGPITLRIHEALKRRIMERAYVPGARLDPQAIAAELSSSTTPVRDALHMLAGEELVVLNSHGGFASAPIDEPGLVDLYAWNNAVLHLALRDQQPIPPRQITMDANTRLMPLAERTGILFQTIADNSSNVEHGRAMRRIGARLYAAREIEAALLRDATNAIDILSSSYATRDFAALRRLLAKYTRRRQLLAAQIARGLYRDPGSSHP